MSVIQHMKLLKRDHANSPHAPERPHEEQEGPADAPRVYHCDRCGFEMSDLHCKVVCPNCGARWDCSDLNIYTD